MATLNTVLSLTVNSIIGILLQISQNVQNSCFLNYLQEHIMQIRAHVELDNIFFWKLHVFKINMIYFIAV